MCSYTAAALVNWRLRSMSSAEIVEELLHGVVERAAAEFLESEVEHALSLEGEAEHLVGLDAFGFHHLLAASR